MALFSISQSKLRLLSPELTTGTDVVFSIVLHSVILLIELKSKHWKNLKKKKKLHGLTSRSRSLSKNVAMHDAK